MRTQTELAKEFGQALGFEARITMLLFGIVGLFFPGTAMYSLLVAIARIFKDYDVQKLIKELQD